MDLRELVRAGNVGPLLEECNQLIEHCEIAYHLGMRDDVEGVVSLRPR